MRTYREYRRIRLMLGLTQRELAVAAGFPTLTLVKYEGGYGELDEGRIWALERTVRRFARARYRDLRDLKLYTKLNLTKAPTLAERRRRKRAEQEVVLKQEQPEVEETDLEEQPIDLT
jgi:transcriptional regulator with XRE-family HTH domain